MLEETTDEWKNDGWQKVPQIWFRILEIIYFEDWRIHFWFCLFRSIVLDYGIEIKELRHEDRIFVGGSLGNYSLAGFEMILSRHVSHYIINYYLPSGLFVVVSWISFLVPADVIPGKLPFNRWQSTESTTFRPCIPNNPPLNSTF